MLFGITLAMGPAIAHQSWNTVVKRVSADGGPRSVNRSSSGLPLGCHALGSRSPAAWPINWFHPAGVRA